MSDRKRFIDADVLTEARTRIHHIFDIFDTVGVCFSGGKDSLVTLHLVDDVRQERGISTPLKVVFRDEELIPDDVINFVQSYYHSGRYDFRYYAVPLKSEKFIMGRKYPYVQWDPNRQWIRPKPDFAITDAGDRVFDQYTMDAFVAQTMKGKIALLTGIRADESLIRFASLTAKKNESYIAAVDGTPRVKLCKPIYDWTEKDIFRYLYDNQIRYCTIYDLQVLNDDNLRVSTPLHAESAKRFNKLRTLYPTFYQQLVDVFPEMLVQERYWSQFDRSSVLLSYPHSWNGIIQYVKEHVDPTMQASAIKYLGFARRIRENKLRQGWAPETCGGYPLLYVFKQVVNGNYKREIQPKKPSKEDLAYEGLV